MSSTTPRIDPGRADRFVSDVGDYLLRLPWPSLSASRSKRCARRGASPRPSWAEQLGLEQTHVSRIEGRDDLKLSTLLAYLHALDAGSVQLHVGFSGGARVALELAASS